MINSRLGLVNERVRTFIDTGASISIWSSDENLFDLINTDPLEINGISGKVTANIAAIHPDFGPVVLCPECPANLLSLHVLRKQYIVEYNYLEDGFKITDKVNHNKFYFDKNIDGLYELRTNQDVQEQVFKAANDHQAPPQPAEIEPNSTQLNATRNNYTQVEVSKARDAREACRKLGHVGKDNLIRAIRAGSCIETTVTVQDIHRAERLFGPCPGCSAGKITATKKGYIDPEIEDVKVSNEVKKEILHADLFYLPSIAKTRCIVLMSVGQRTRFIIVTKLASKHSEVIAEAWNTHLSIYSRGQIQVTHIYTDNEVNLGVTSNHLSSKGVALVQHASGSHEPTCERRVRVIKERIRSTLYDLPYPLPFRLYFDLLLWVVQGINLLPDSLNEENDIRSARERVTGTKPNMRLILKFGFGDEVMYHIPNSEECGTHARVSTGIVVGRDPDGMNLKIFDMSSRSTVVRRSARPIPVQQATIDTLTELAKADARDPLEEGVELLPRLTGNDSLVVQYRESYNDMSDTDSDDEGGVEEDTNQPEVPQPEDAEQPQVEQTSHQYNLRSNRGIGHSVHIAHHHNLENLSAQQAITQYGAPAVSAIKAELQKMLDLQVFSPAPLFARITNVIPCSMFLKPKFFGDGKFDRLKARLVAGGHRQSWDPEEDCSSPTVRWETVLSALAVATQHSLTITIADVPSAYLQAPRLSTSEAVYMRINSEVASILVELMDSWRQHLTPKGEIIVVLHKAMYGLKDSGLRFYEDLSSTLQQGGFSKSNIEPCLFIKTIGSNIQCMVLSYVDDLLIISKNQAIVSAVIQLLESKYGEMSKQFGPTFSFVGTNIVQDAESKTIKINCPGFIKKLQEKYSPESASRAHPHHPEIDHQEEEREKEDPLEDQSTFRSLVMSLMYVAKRVRPDILFATVLLATKVGNATPQDYSAAIVVLEYLCSTAELGIQYSSEEGNTLKTYADASFACHPDGRSHTGIICTVSGGPVFFKSSKQKLVTKSTTDSELIACDEGIDVALYLNDLLGEMGNSGDAPIPIYQDNQTTIITMTKGRLLSKRRNIKAKLAYAREQIQEGNIQLIYLPSNSMIADGLTKALRGAAYTEFKSKVIK